MESQPATYILGDLSNMDHLYGPVFSQIFDKNSLFSHI